MQSLFVISNTVSWGEVLYRSTRVRSYDLIPTEEKGSEMSAIIFITVVVIGSFFLLNLYIGVIITSYNREKELMGKDFMLTEK